MRRLHGVQYLRAVAACGVVMFHAGHGTGIYFRPGEAGVDVFFVLSGFLMWAITNAETRPASFIRDRIIRIVPNYWAATSVMLIGALAGLFPAVRLTAGHVLSSYFFLPWTSPSNGHVWPLLAPGWTLNYELAFYALFTAVLFVQRRWQLASLTGVLGGLALMGALTTPATTAGRFYTDLHVLEFLAGVWLARHWLHQAAAPYRPALASLLVVVAAAGFALTALAPASTPKPLMYGPLAVLGMKGVLIFERRPGGIAEWTLPHLLGNASYSIYLWHTLAISVSRKVVAMFAFPSLLAFSTNVMSGLIVGLVAYACFERPVLLLFRRARRREAPSVKPATPAPAMAEPVVVEPALLVDPMIPPRDPVV